MNQRMVTFLLRSTTLYSTCNILLIRQDPKQQLSSSCAGLKSPVSEPFLRATLEGLQRMLAKPVTKKKPITVNMLEALLQDAQESDFLSDLRLATGHSGGADKC